MRGDSGPEGSIRGRLIERLELVIPDACGNTGDPDGVPEASVAGDSASPGPEREPIDLTEPVETANPVFSRRIDPLAARTAYARMLEDTESMRWRLAELDDNDPALPEVERQLLRALPGLAHEPRTDRPDEDHPYPTDPTDGERPSLPFRDAALLRFLRTEQSANSNYLITTFGAFLLVFGLCVFALRSLLPEPWGLVGLLVLIGLAYLLLISTDLNLQFVVAAVFLVVLLVSLRTALVGIGLAAIGTLGLTWTVTGNIVFARRRLADLSEIAGEVHEARASVDRLIGAARPS